MLTTTETGVSTTDLSLADYSFEQDMGQLNRFWFTLWLWEVTQEFGLDVQATYYPSLSDSEVTLVTDQGSILHFDSEKFDRQVNRNRLQAILQTQVSDSLNLTESLRAGSVDYVDMRSAKRVYVCLYGQPCSE